VRERTRDSGRAGLVQGLLQEFALSSSEGVALMCLAEALLRIPDAATRDALIRDKISSGDWRSHLGQSPSLFVNAATWGLLLTGRLVATHSDVGLGAALRRVVGRGGEPLIRRGVDMAMRLMGEQFVTGETIEQALVNSRPREAEGFRYSYDMLGEAAMTTRDAEAYLAAYEAAIQAIGRASAGRGIVAGPGISIKLSALHPRYSRAQVERVMSELYPRLLQLAELACRYDIGFNIDAEEADRLELSLDLLERLCFEPALAGWNGIGFVIQAYQKRCPAVVDWLIDLARRSGRRLMVRLVKGAYWDSEIKRAQLDGQAGYPVYTRKAYTDVAYLACAKKLLAAPTEIYPQFATHNAHTLAAVHALAGPGYEDGQYEFQCLHGMGEPLYEQVVGPASEGRLGRPCRIYAPVGTHDTLLAYLVRRLLENGANTSFVNRIASDAVPLEELVQNPVRTVEELAAGEGAVGLPHPAIVLPRALFGATRVNSLGIDLAGESQLRALDGAFAAHAAAPWTAEPLLGVDAIGDDAHPVLNPADRRDVVGHCRDATGDDVQAALAAASGAAADWAATAPEARATMLDRAADRLEADTLRLVTLLVREAGKTAANAVSEVREAVDFLRYYGQQVRRDFDNATHRPLGPVVCISPWNFPLAIFTGQVAAALAAGNPVLAKPAEQTPLVAAEAVRALRAAGVPPAVLQLLPGRGESVGAALVGDPRVEGVLFTGSTEVARLLQQSLARRLGAPRPAGAAGRRDRRPERDGGGLLGAGRAGGGRRRQLRLRQRRAALLGPARALRPARPRPAPGDDARGRAARALDRRHPRPGGRRRPGDRRGSARRYRAPHRDDACRRPAGGAARGPTRGHRPGQLRPADGDRDHTLGRARARGLRPGAARAALRPRGPGRLLGQINATGYGLTLGVHTRIDETVAQVVDTAHAGNIYVNRNVVGAVVGVQPFGGEGLSGTGPKAGGPLYLLRLLSARPDDDARAAVVASGGEALAPVRGLAMGDDADDPALRALRRWALAQQPVAPADWIEAIDRFAAHSPVGRWRSLPGPTGEANLFAVAAREAVLCLAADDGDRLIQLAAVLAVGSRALWPAAARPAWQRLPEEARDRVALVDDWTRPQVAFDAVLHHGTSQELREVLRAVAARPGAIVGVTALAVGDMAIPLERLVVERSLSINTAAAGGNASLMTMG
jgi:RHH-type proline utilization regulon transcriptional repressor/proline dehydrogenase/delta 1-pyrroline-5-carboxylate dehydrogenase